MYSICARRINIAAALINVAIKMPERTSGNESLRILGMIAELFRTSPCVCALFQRRDLYRHRYHDCRMVFLLFP